MQLEMEAIQEAERVALQLTLSALKNATVLSKAESVEVGPLEVEILVSTTSFEDWDIGDAHNELELVTFEIANWQSNHRELKEYLRLVFRLLRADETMAETLAGSEYRVQIGISRAELVALLDIAVEPQQLERRSVTPPNYLHYSTKTSLTESFVTGKAVRAICGKWWVPVGDEQTHRHLPVCPECERLEPFAQALRAYLRGVTGR